MNLRAIMDHLCPVIWNYCNQTGHTLIISTAECERLSCAMNYVLSHAAFYLLSVPCLSDLFLSNTLVHHSRSLILKTVWKWIISHLGPTIYFFYERKKDLMVEIGHFLERNWPLVWVALKSVSDSLCLLSYKSIIMTS